MLPHRAPLCRRTVLVESLTYYTYQNICSNANATNFRTHTRWTRVRILHSATKVCTDCGSALNIFTLVRHDGSNDHYTPPATTHHLPLHTTCHYTPPATLHHLPLYTTTCHYILYVLRYIETMPAAASQLVWSVNYLHAGPDKLHKPRHGGACNRRHGGACNRRHGSSYTYTHIQPALLFNYRTL